MFMEMVGIAKVRRNIVLDFAAWQRWVQGFPPDGDRVLPGRALHPRCDRSEADVRQRLERLPRLCPLSRLGEGVHRNPRWVQEAGITFTREEIDGLLAAMR